MSTISVTKTSLNEILPLRDLFLQENNFQIRYNACHDRGWTDSYIVMLDYEKIGYGSIKGRENHVDRDTIFEFYVIPSIRHKSSIIFSELLSVSGAGFIECQSNDRLLTSLLYQFSRNINSDVILFEVDHSSDIFIDKIVFRKRNDADLVFDHKSEPIGDFVLEFNKEIVATGGFLLHYNKPFADLYMEVKEDYRRKGFGSFLIQELKKHCYISGRVPAARCNIDNAASKATLIKAGMRIAGFMLLGQVFIINK
jgi:GNAT superfamily N-acetyltransferase